ncbi:50S ribosomal protein L29 [Candidatus Gracilibacteria bacterium]|jgi:ribosomal protein L29|nr:50S ribosomal protein L29 [Candidatus Gracilibacteria bacterium]
MAPKKKSAQVASLSLKSLADLKTLNKAELTTELQSAQKELYVLTMKKELGELKQSHLMKKSRKYIAQVSTFLTSAV